jgi:hypothetical protein
MRTRLMTRTRRAAGVARALDEVSVAVAAAGGRGEVREAEVLVAVAAAVAAAAATAPYARTTQVAVHSSRPPSLG